MGTETKLILYQQIWILICQVAVEGPIPFPLFIYFYSNWTADWMECHCPLALEVLSSFVSEESGSLCLSESRKESEGNGSPIQSIFYEEESIIFFIWQYWNICCIFHEDIIEIWTEVWNFWMLSYSQQLALQGSRVVFLKGYTTFRYVSFETKLLLSIYNIRLVSSLLFLLRSELLIEWVLPCKVLSSVYSLKLSLGVIFKK